MITERIAIALLLAVGAVGCKFDDAKLKGLPFCESSSDCPSGQACLGNVCGGAGDAGTDIPVPQADLGPDAMLPDLPAGDLPADMMRPDLQNPVDVPPRDIIRTDGPVLCNGLMCGSNQTCCDSPTGQKCVDTSQSATDCGRCGFTCTSPNQCCDGSCVDVRNDKSHCGNCTNTCTIPGDACCGGSCVAPADPACSMCAPLCLATEECCMGGSCADLTTNVNHCGSCARTCDPGQHCCDSDCKPRDEMNCAQCGDICTQGSTCCSTGCKALMLDDDNNCGQCGKVCEAGTKCCDGKCADLENDNDHCGMCRHSCAVTACRNGGCL